MGDEKRGDGHKWPSEVRDTILKESPKEVSQEEEDRVPAPAPEPTKKGGQNE